jgi:hypothetical protein
MYSEFGLAAGAVAITGNICVGRGISIMSPEFIFNYGIMSGYSSQKKADASQSAGRLKANMKWWTDYAPPVVFTTSAFDTVAKGCEEKSRALAKIAYDNQSAGLSTDLQTVQQSLRTPPPAIASTPKHIKKKFIKVFKLEKEAHAWSVAKGKQFSKLQKDQTGEYVGVQTLKTKDGRFPSKDYIENRFWGIKADGVDNARITPIDVNGETHICIYYYPILPKKKIKIKWVDDEASSQ